MKNLYFLEWMFCGLVIVIVKQDVDVEGLIYYFFVDEKIYFGLVLEFWMGNLVLWFIKLVFDGYGIYNFDYFEFYNVYKLCEGIYFYFFSLYQEGSFLCYVLIIKLELLFEKYVFFIMQSLR